MPITDFLNRLQPIQLYVTLVVSICYVVGQIVLSHLTHSLTLQFAAYHMICNIIALTGRILTIKISNKPLTRQIDRNILTSQCKNMTKENMNCVTIKKIPDEENRIIEFSKTIAVPQKIRSSHEQKLRNTFGWVRIDCLTISICFIFLASFSVSHFIEVIKMLTHMENKDTAHCPVLTLLYGGLGIIMVSLAYFLIGGYTMHQGSFMRSVTVNGEVLLNRQSITEINKECHNLNKNIDSEMNSVSGSSGNDLNIISSFDYSERQGYNDTARDISSTIFVIICSSIIYLSDDNEEITKYIDPVISLISCGMLIAMSFPYMRESCLVLLQTIPGSIDIENFKNSLLSKFTEIVSVHDLHIWSLTTSKYVSTAHIIFKNPESYLKIISDVKKFFEDQGIKIVTIQPEFEKQPLNNQLPEECKISCTSLECLEKKCCQSQTDLKEIIAIENPKQIQINGLQKDKKNFCVMNVKSLQDIRLENPTKLYLDDKNENNNVNVQMNVSQISNKFSSDSQISSIGSTVSTNVSIKFDPDSRNNSQETNNTTATTTTNTNNSSVTSSSEHFVERL